MISGGLRFSLRSTPFPRTRLIYYSDDAFIENLRPKIGE